jgi:hypothetical protein
MKRSPGRAAHWLRGGQIPDCQGGIAGMTVLNDAVSEILTPE